MKYTLLVEVNCDETLDEIEAMLDEEQENGMVLGNRACLGVSIQEIQESLSGDLPMVTNLLAKVACLEDAVRDMTESIKMCIKEKENHNAR